MNTKGIFIIATFAALLSSALTLGIANSFKNTASADVTILEQQLGDLRAEVARLKKQSDSSQRMRNLRRSSTADASDDLQPDDNDVESHGDQAIDIQEPLITERLSDQQRIEMIAEQRKQRFLNSGLTENDVEWILRTESEVQLQFLQEQYQLRREQANANQSQSSPSRLERIKQELGDDYYEKYLEANGLPTYVPVRQVLDSSAADIAGLLPGDRILSYGGNRVFNIRELNHLTIQGQVGQSVLLEIERNGQPIQLTLPRGPIGIVNRRSRF